MELIKVDQSSCIKCGICTKVCPPRVLRMGENGPKAIEPQLCMACGHCVAACPYEAIDNIKTPLSNQTDLREIPVLNAEMAQQFLRSRRSIRCYKDKAVSREQLIKLVDIARFAPAPGNSQGISYIVVEDKKILKEATEVTINWMEAQIRYPSNLNFPLQVRAFREDGIDKILRDAPVLIVATAPKKIEKGRESTILSFAYLELYATALGLGSCFAGLFEMCAFSNYYPLLELLNIPEGKVITGALIVGYPKYSYKRLVDRKQIDITWIG
jgi:nitroreductase/NAD-dependent dihydropyrimidine dehydrogenase PreA subunit